VVVLGSSTEVIISRSDVYHAEAELAHRPDPRSAVVRA
jgi:hypothetical protein